MRRRTRRLKAHPAARTCADSVGLNSSIPRCTQRMFLFWPFWRARAWSFGGSSYQLCAGRAGARRIRPHRCGLGGPGGEGGGGLVGVRSPDIHLVAYPADPLPPPRLPLPPSAGASALPAPVGSGATLAARPAHRAPSPNSSPPPAAPPPPSPSSGLTTRPVGPTPAGVRPPSSAARLTPSAPVPSSRRTAAPY